MRDPWFGSGARVESCINSAVKSACLWTSIVFAPRTAPGACVARGDGMLSACEVRRLCSWRRGRGSSPRAWPGSAPGGERPPTRPRAKSRSGVATRASGPSDGRGEEASTARPRFAAGAGRWRIAGPRQARAEARFHDAHLLRRRVIAPRARVALRRPSIGRVALDVEHRRLVGTPRKRQSARARSPAARPGPRTSARCDATPALALEPCHDSSAAIQMSVAAQTLPAAQPVATHERRHPAGRAPGG